MKKTVLWVVLGLVVLVVAVVGYSYNDLQRADEQVEQQWSEVVNQYQRRADLIPNLVETVKRYAEHEEGVFVDVAKARQQVNNIQVTPDMLNDPQAVAQYQNAQGALTQSLGRLIAVAENYPDLKANQTFENLMTQLESTENRVTVARNRYIESVRDYNVLVRTFPGNIAAMIIGMDKKPNFSVANEDAISTAPKVEFN
ncbi:LemA family protein [Cardiobacteriaceae bacterium TAE3-ERU3]|nr:LemA family protein [Cardiobacteriaceae bacterium TAE3-ERU3]